MNISADTIGGLEAIAIKGVLFTSLFTRAETLIFTLVPESL
jgi:hypothetical protein